MNWLSNDCSQNEQAVLHGKWLGKNGFKFKKVFEYVQKSKDVNLKLWESKAFTYVNASFKCVRKWLKVY